MSKYEVIAGNIGEVYSGDDREGALSAFHAYAEKSREGIGRGAYEDVVMFCGGDIERDYASPRCKLCGDYLAGTPGTVCGACK